MEVVVINISVVQSKTYVKPTKELTVMLLNTYAHLFSKADRMVTKRETSVQRPAYGTQTTLMGAHFNLATFNYFNSIYAPTYLSFHSPILAPANSALTAATYQPTF